MGTIHNPYRKQLQALSELMLAVAGESVTMVKRNAPEQSLKLKRQDEWGIYLEFLKIMFDLADRLSAIHVPLKEQPQFMDNLEDAVTLQLKTVLAPAFEAGTDQMEIVLTVGNAVAESRRTYEQYRFLVTEESQQKNEMFRAFGEQVAKLLGAAGNGQVAAAATLCAGAIVPAMQAILEDKVPPQASPVATTKDSPGSPIAEGTAGQARPSGDEIKLVTVMASMKGEEVETRWGLHPRFRQDLKPEEVQELTRLMNRITKILGERYAAVAFSDQWATWHQTGHA